MSDGECVHKMYVLRPCLAQAVTKRRSVVRSLIRSFVVGSFVRSFVRSLFALSPTFCFCFRRRRRRSSFVVRSFVVCKLFGVHFNRRRVAAVVTHVPGRGSGAGAGC